MWIAGGRIGATATLTGSRKGGEEMLVVPGGFGEAGGVKLLLVAPGAEELPLILVVVSS